MTRPINATSKKCLHLYVKMTHIGSGLMYLMILLCFRTLEKGSAHPLTELKNIAILIADNIATSVVNCKSHFLTNR